MDVDPKESPVIQGAHEALDRVNVPRQYMGVNSNIRERVNLLVKFLELRGVKLPCLEEIE